MRGTLTIECLSDTCFSMPASLSVVVDSEACADDLGLPKAPGKTLHSLLRDTWLSVQPYLDPDKKLGHALLGEPGKHQDTGVLRIGDALMPDVVRERVHWALKRAENPLPPAGVRNAFYDTRSQTRIDRGTGAPATDTLRKLRVVPQGTVLAASLSCARALTTEEKEHLDVLLGLTRHAGLDRNRGLGYVKLKVNWDEQSDQEQPDQAPPPTANGNPLRFLHYRLTLQAPCVFRKQDLDPNSCSTHRFIPGAAIRGALAGVLLREEAGDLERIIASGEVRFLNAYPEVMSARSVPSALTWQRDKNPQLDDWEAEPRDALYDLFGEDPQLTDVQREPLHEPFCARVGSEYHPVSSEVGMQTHQTRNRRRGIPVGEEEATEKSRATQVYVYESLRTGQSFRGCVVVPTDLYERLASLLTGSPLWIGRSARSGYGGAPLVEVLRHEDDGGEVAGSAPETITEGEAFSVLLTSPAVLRDPLTGQHDPWLLGDEIRRRFQGRAEVTAACVSPDVSRGFNRLWRTELPQLPCAGAGSTVLLRALSDLDAQTLIALQAHPIGERAADGLGCFIICCEARGGLSVEKPNSSRDLLPPQEPGTAGDTGTYQMRLYRLRLRRLLAEHAIYLARHSTGSASVSLFQRLRVPLRGPEWRAVYRGWLGKGQRGDPPSREFAEKQRRELESIRVDGNTLRKLLEQAAVREPNSPYWAPVLPTEDLSTQRHHVEQARFRLAPEPQAGDLWEEVKQESTVFFLDMLLGQLGRKAKKERM